MRPAPSTAYKCMMKAAFTAALCIVAAACGTNDRQALQIATQAYGKAWASRDVERILALHAEQSEFVLFVDGTERAVGKAAIRDQFRAILREQPGYASKVVDIAFGDDFAVIEYEIHGNTATPFRLGRRRFTPSGSPYEVRSIDVIRFKEGLVTSKHTYVDIDAVHNNSITAEILGRVR